MTIVIHHKHRLYSPECRVRPMWDIEGVASTEAAEDQLSRREGQKKRREEKRREEKR